MRSALYQYHINQDAWDKPSQPPYIEYGLVFIDGLATTVGGTDPKDKIMFRSCNELFSLIFGGWYEMYPPMTTPRTYPAAVSTRYDGRDYVIAAGQESNFRRITSIEVFSNGKWCHRADLPHHIQFLLATVSDTTFYVVSGTDFMGYSILLSELLVDERPKESPLSLQWTRLPHLPLRLTTPACMGNAFFLVGGKDNRDENSSAIFQLINGQFVVVGHLSEPRAMCCVVRIAPGRMLVAGGILSHTVDEISAC